MWFEVEIVLLRTILVKRNVGKGTPTNPQLTTAPRNRGGFLMPERRKNGKRYIFEFMQKDCN